MQGLLFRRQTALADRELQAYARLLGLDEERFRADFEGERGRPRIEADVRSGELSGVEGTPSIFIDGRQHLQDYDPKTLTSALTSARR